MQRVEYLNSRRPEQGSASMFSNCANPACSAPFEYRRGGIFRFYQFHPKGEEPKKLARGAALLAARELLRNIFP
jgi:hypothetical protein